MALQGGTTNLQGSSLTLQKAATAPKLQPAVPAKVLQPAQGAIINQTPYNNAPVYLPVQNDSGSVLRAVDSRSYASTGPTAAQQQAAAQAAAERAAQADEQNYWQDQINILNGQMGRTDTALNQGLNGINDSYNLQLGRTNEQQSQTLRNYGIKRNDTTAGRQNAFQRVDTNARTLSDSLRRVLGLARAGVSSAANELAPWAVARQATQQRAQTQDTYGRNLRDIDLAEGDAKTQFGNVLQDLLFQRREKEQGLRSGIESNRIAINEQLADASMKRAMAGGASYSAARAAREPFTANINSGNSRLQQLVDQFRNPVYNAQPVNVQMPNLANYNVDQAQLQPSDNTQYSADVSAYLPFLKRDERRPY